MRKFTLIVFSSIHIVTKIAWNQRAEDESILFYSSPILFCQEIRETNVFTKEIAK